MSPATGESVEEGHSPEQELLSQCLKAANELRERLHIDEETYRGVAPTAYAAGRDYYLYGVLDTIERTGLALIQQHSLVFGEGPDGGAGGEHARLVRNMMLTIATEQAVWMRKLMELLVELINFSHTNEHPYFRHFMLLTLYSDSRKANHDLEAYYGSRSGNIAQFTGLVDREISRLETQVDLSRCWYLSGKVKRPGSRKPPTFNELLDTALGSASKSERLVLGLSYHAYSQNSRLIHAGSGGADPRPDPEFVKATHGQLLNCVVHVLVRCRRLLAIRSSRGASALLARLNDDVREPNAIYAEATSRRVRRGDFVIAQGRLAEVLRTASGRHGYKCYLVRFLEEPPLPEFREDWYPPYQLRVLTRVDDLRRDVRALLAKHGVNLPSRTRIANAVRAVLTQWGQAGWKEYASGDVVGARAKMAAYLSERSE